MRTVTIEWLPEDERFTASGTHRGHTIAINAPHSSPGRPATGFSAVELLLAGAGTCAAWDVVEILRKGRQPVVGIDIRVTGEQRAQPPNAFESIAVHFMIRGDGLRKASVERAVRLACDRYCAVLATVRGVSRVASTFELLPETANSAPAADAGTGNGA